MAEKPILYLTISSPPCRAVLLTAAALGLDLDLRHTYLKEGDEMTTHIFELNPQHTIPVLDDNGTVITDSHVICGYLVDKYASDDTLYPKSAEKRRLVDERLFFDCGHIFPRVRVLIEPILYFGFAEMPQRWKEYMERAYDGMEQNLINSPYLCGEQMTIADLCCMASISSAILFVPVEPKQYPNLNAWIERLSGLPYYQKSNQEGLNAAKRIIERNMVVNKTVKKA